MSKAGSNLEVSYVVVLIAATALYVFTCAPGVVWQDSGVIQYRIWHNDIQGHLGLALSHPLYYIIAIAAKKIPLEEFAYRINVMNAVISALAVANLFLLLRLWFDIPRQISVDEKKTADSSGLINSNSSSGAGWAALLGAATLALSHTFWWHATVPETYNLAVALLLAELIMLLQYAKTSRKRYLYFLALLNGLAVANHMLACLAFACYFVFIVTLVIKKQIKLRDLVAMALLWIAGALPYEYLIIKNIQQSDDFWGTLASAAFGTRWRGDVLNTTLTVQIIKENLMYIALNFPTPNILLFFVGVLCLYKFSPKRWFAHIILALLILFFAFAFRYTVPDRYAFFIPFYCIVSLLIGVGVYKFSNRESRAIVYLFVIFVLATVPVYIMAPKIAERWEIKISGRRIIPYRDDDKYFLRPWKMGYKGAEKFAVEALYTVKPLSVIYADATTAPPLLYAQEVQNQRLGDYIKIVSSIGSSENSPEFNERTIEKLLSERAVYVVSPDRGYCPDFLLGRYGFEPVGVLWRIVERQNK